MIVYNDDNTITIIGSENLFKALQELLKPYIIVPAAVPPPAPNQTSPHGGQEPPLST